VSDRSRRLRPAVTAARRACVAAERLTDRLDLPREGTGLLVFGFHSFFERESDVDSALVYPQEGLTPRRLSALIEHMHGAGYRFISIDDIAGIGAGKYAAITFDDGYANNLAALDTVRTHRVPITVFLPTAYLDSDRRYWWDAVHTERSRQGRAAAAIDRELEWLTPQRSDEIDRYLRAEFGDAVFRSRGDLDRVLTSSEARALAEEPLVTIGNHTVEHPFLPALDDTEIRDQLVSAQAVLTSLTGTAPASIAYPEGAHDDRVLRIAQEVGFRVGITVEPVREAVPVAPDRLLHIGRFQLRREQELEPQLRRMRGRVQVEASVARAWRRVRRVT
jgi:peptidoglycan/xylan/chitin deacetylase (PgdA/CDA1 family)